MLSDILGRSTRAERADLARIPSILQCGLLIAALKLLLQSRGFAWTVERIRRRVESTAPTERVDMVLVTAYEHRVATAAALYPGRARCLEQSLVLYYMLRRRGVPVKYCQGVQAYPFQAHAWVEYDGQPINDVGEHVELFARLPVQLP